MKSFDRKKAKLVKGVSTMFRHNGIGVELMITAPDKESLHEAINGLMPCVIFDGSKFRRTSTTINTKTNL
jgi:hypothetical protein